MIFATIDRIFRRGCECKLRSLIGDDNQRVAGLSARYGICAAIIFRFMYKCFLGKMTIVKLRIEKRCPKERRDSTLQPRFAQLYLRRFYVYELRAEPFAARFIIQTLSNYSALSLKPEPSGISYQIVIISDSLNWWRGLTRQWWCTSHHGTDKKTDEIGVRVACRSAPHRDKPVP